MCFNKCFKHLDLFLFIFKHKILEMSGHSTTLSFPLFILQVQTNPRQALEYIYRPSTRLGNVAFLCST